MKTRKKLERKKKDTELGFLNQENGLNYLKTMYFDVLYIQQLK